MQRVRLGWLVAISLMSAGSLAAHSLAYRLVDPNPVERADLLARTGHGYLSAMPALLAALVAIGIVALVGLALGAARGDRRPGLAWYLALLPLIGFALQEHLERLVAGDSVTTVVLQPTFLVGLALQIPFALAALWTARVLARAATSLGRALAASPPAGPASPFVPARPAAAVLLPRLSALALGSSERGPPRRSRP